MTLRIDKTRSHNANATIPASNDRISASFFSSLLNYQQQSSRHYYDAVVVQNIAEKAIESYIEYFETMTKQISMCTPDILKDFLAKKGSLVTVVCIYTVNTKASGQQNIGYFQ